MMQHTTQGQARDNGSSPRVGSLVHPDHDHPSTLGGRLAQRRTELGLKQETVASQIFITQKSQSKLPGRAMGSARPLSRTAYVMYETDSVPPPLELVSQMAVVLKTSPAWIAFGIGQRDQIDEVEYDPKTDSYHTARTWALDENWLRERFEVQVADIALVTAPDYTPSLAPGDVAIVKRGVEPTASGGEFVYGCDDGLRVAHVTRPARGGPYRVYEADLKSHTDVEPGDFNVFGRVIGKITDLSAPEGKRVRR